MHSLPQLEVNVTPDFAINAAYSSICMYTRGTARTDNRIMREAATLVKAGYAVSIIDVECNPSLPAEEEFQGVNIKHVIMPSWNVPSRFKPWFLVKAFQLFVRSVFRLFQVQADIYHAHDETALPACYIISRLRRKPLIFDAHELPLLQQPLSEMSLRRRWLHAFSTCLLPHIISCCSAVITVSPPIAQHIHKHYHVPKVTLIRNIPALQAVPKNDRLRQYLGLNPNKHVALYQGGLYSDRGLDKLIHTAKFLDPDIVIVIMGNGSKEILTQLEALIASEEVHDQVKIIPAVPYQNLLDWTASADIGLIIYSPDYSMNVRMCLPNKLFEYLMAGLPILSSQLDAIAEVVKSYCCGQIVTSLSPIDVAAAINIMLADRGALALMRQNALEATQREFHWEKESQKLVHLYQDILTAKGVEKSLNIHPDSAVERKYTS